MKLEKIFGGSKKGQAVMEYLITYGLALFVILIVLAILVAVVLPSLKAPETCQFTQPGFTCNQKPHAVFADTAYKVFLAFQLDNGQGKAVNILGISCITTAVGNVRKTDIPDFAAPIGIAAGASYTPDEAIECLDDDGTTQTTLSPNSNYKGVLAVKYKYQQDLDLAPDRLAVATVTGSVLSE